jgi:hypothetical protein
MADQSSESRDCGAAVATHIAAESALRDDLCGGVSPFCARKRAPEQQIVNGAS